MKNGSCGLKCIKNNSFEDLYNPTFSPIIHAVIAFPILLFDFPDTRAVDPDPHFKNIGMNI